MKKLFFIFLLAGCTALAQSAKKDKALEELFNIMKGSYTSEKQAATDKDYFNISLKNIYENLRDSRCFRFCCHL